LDETGGPVGTAWLKVILVLLACASAGSQALAACAAVGGLDVEECSVTVDSLAHPANTGFYGLNGPYGLGAMIASHQADLPRPKFGSARG
jgi:hypothetical protein